jgi:hypothetical protein
VYCRLDAETESWLGSRQVLAAKLRSTPVDSAGAVRVSHGLGRRSVAVVWMLAGPDPVRATTLIQATACAASRTRYGTAQLGGSAPAAESRKTPPIKMPARVRRNLAVDATRAVFPVSLTEYGAC